MCVLHGIEENLLMGASLEPKNFNLVLISAIWQYLNCVIYIVTFAGVSRSAS